MTFLPLRQAYRWWSIFRHGQRYTDSDIDDAPPYGHTEAPINWLVNDPRFNPLYHTGTITIFLLIVILLTGIYLTMFYPFGFAISYNAVADIESNLIGRVIRAMHRYASDAAVIFGLLHGWRTFFQDRFRGPRWLAWVSGVGMAVVVWFIGITGYWLIWDERTQLLNQSLFNILGGFKSGQAFIVDYMIGDAAGNGWVFMMLVIVLHVGLSALTAYFLWLHLKRMSRAKWLPPKYWMVISVFVLLLSAALFPLGMLPQLSNTQLPAQAPIDLFFLFYLPTFLRGPQALFWSILLFIVGIVTALPWIMPRAKKLEPIKVDLANCDGCTLCERDCPYLAIKMIPRADGARPVAHFRCFSIRRLALVLITKFVELLVYRRVQIHRQKHRCRAIDSHRNRRCGIA